MIQPNEIWRECIYWNEIFNTEQVKEINRVIENNYDPKKTDYPATRADGTVPKNISSVKIIYYHQIKYFVGDLVNNAIDLTEREFGYHVDSKHNLDKCNFNVYDSKSKDHYDWHTDGSESDEFDCKCTLLINLSTEPYKGGEFQIYPYSAPVDIFEFSKPGSAFMFKSFVSHRVKPVTSGMRKTLSIFMDGPKFK